MPAILNETGSYVTSPFCRLLPCCWKSEFSEHEKKF